MPIVLVVFSATDVPANPIDPDSAEMEYDPTLTRLTDVPDSVSAPLATASFLVTPRATVVPDREAAPDETASLRADFRAVAVPDREVLPAVAPMVRIALNATAVPERDATPLFVAILYAVILNVTAVP